MATRRKPATLTDPTLAQRKSALLEEALGDGYAVEVIDEETVRIVSHGRPICSISFDAEPPREAHAVTRRT